MTTLNVNIPFEGFYESLYSSELDEEETRFAEYRAEEEKEEQLEHLRLTSDEIAGALMYASNYGAMHNAVAANYASAFDDWANDNLGTPLNSFNYEAMTSPREYNFTTDQIFCDADEAVMQKLFDDSAAEGHAALIACIKERFTSRDGFISFYSNDPAEWLAKPLNEWDHNELGTLLRAAIARADTDENFRYDMYERVTHCDGLTHEWEAGVDWQEYERRVAEARADKLEAWQDENPDADPAPLPQPRCPDTLELPFGD